MSTPRPKGGRPARQLCHGRAAPQPDRRSGQLGLRPVPQQRHRPDARLLRPHLHHPLPRPGVHLPRVLHPDEPARRPRAIAHDTGDLPDRRGHADALAPGADAVVNIRWPSALVPPRDGDSRPTPVTWHPCLLVEVSPHDGPAPAGNHVWQDNNLTQKNITIHRSDAGKDFAMGLVVGNVESKGRYAEPGNRSVERPASGAALRRPGRSEAHRATPTPCRTARCRGRRGEVRYNFILGTPIAIAEWPSSPIGGSRESPSSPRPALLSPIIVGNLITGGSQGDLPRRHHPACTQPSA